MKKFVSAIILASLCSLASAQDIEISIENLATADGFFLTPLWAGLHGADFDLFDVGSAVTPGLEALAEDGIIGDLSMEFAQGGRLEFDPLANPAGFGGAPVLDPGEMASSTLTPINPVAYQYLSFASMLIPSNDAFIGTDAPIRVFNPDGSFMGTQVFEIRGSDIYDAGTEENDTMGAPFSGIGGDATDTVDGVAAAHPGLANFEGTPIPTGGTIGAGTAPGADDLVARITIRQVPEPASFSLMGLAGLSLLGLRRRRRR